MCKRDSRPYSAWFRAKAYEIFLGLENQAEPQLESVPEITGRALIPRFLAILGGVSLWAEIWSWTRETFLKKFNQNWCVPQTVPNQLHSICPHSAAQSIHWLLGRDRKVNLSHWSCNWLEPHHWEFSLSSSAYENLFCFFWLYNVSLGKSLCWLQLCFFFFLPSHSASSQP